MRKNQGESMKSRYNGIKAMLLEFSKNNKTPPNGLPAAAYTNNIFWKAECDTVFLENWGKVSLPVCLTD